MSFFRRVGAFEKRTSKKRFSCQQIIFALVKGGKQQVVLKSLSSNSLGSSGFNLMHGIKHGQSTARAFLACSLPLVRNNKTSRMECLNGICVFFPSFLSRVA